MSMGSTRPTSKAKLWDKHRIISTVSIKHAEFSGLRVTPNVDTSVEDVDVFVEAVLEGNPGDRMRGRKDAIMRVSPWSTWLLSALVLAGSPVVRGQEKPAESEKGRVVTKQVRFGQYVQYLPKGEAVGVLVVVHGQPAGDDIRDIRGLAERFLKRWVEFAEARRLIALAPVFDAENFDSVDGNNGGGYPGLFGRQINADAYVNGIVDRCRPLVAKPWDEKILLYGHSAGGQFANRYAVTNAERLRGAVISAAGWYAMPDPSAHWPSGMGPWSTTFRWGPSQEPQAINVTLDPNGWVKAAMLPLTVVVGSSDIEPQKPRAGHTGTSRVDYARQWVEMMNRLAARRRKEGRVGLVVVEGVGHDSARLTPAAQEALAKVLEGG